MQAVFVNDGRAIDYTPDMDLAAGSVVVLTTAGPGGMTGIAVAAIKAGVVGTLTLEGVFEVPKDNSEFEMAGTVTWDGAAGHASSGASDKLGTCVRAAAATDTTVLVRL